MSTVCAIVPTFNRSAMLRDCLDSLLGQTRPVDEILVVDDGSSDDTPAVAGAYGSPVRVLTKPNGGKASALNLGLAHCHADYVWICDDDDVAEPDGLAAMVEALDQAPDAGFVYGTFRIFHDHDGIRSYRDPDYWLRPGEPDVHIQFMEEMFTFQFAMLVRRSVYEAVGPFREDLIRSQDHEMAIRVARHAAGRFVPVVIFKQRDHAGIRGRAGEGFALEASQRKWLEYGRKIVGELRASYPLELFTPTFARSWIEVRRRRAALLQRACISAERALWVEAAEDLTAAVTATDERPTAEETGLVEVVVRQALPWRLLGDQPNAVALLRKCRRTNRAGRIVITALVRPLLWHARGAFAEGRRRDGVRALHLLVSILGIGQSLQRMRMSLFG